MAEGRTDPGEATLAVPPGYIVYNELVLTGSRCITKQELAESIEVVRQGRIKPVITQTFSLEEVERAHKLLNEGKIFGRAMLVM